MKVISFRLLILGLLSALAMQAVAEPSCSLEDRHKFFRLDLTVPATFCRESPTDPGCSFPKIALLQLHGLWPNYDQGFPSGTCDPEDCPPGSGDKKFCAYPEPKALYQSAAWRELSAYMAGTEKCLERHEWVKHGTCSGMEPVAYFQWALERTKLITDSLQIPADTELTRVDFDKLIADRLPQYDGAVRLKCKGAAVSALYIHFDWGSEPGKPQKTKGGRNGYGNCSNTIIFPSKP